MGIVLGRSTQSLAVIVNAKSPPPKLHVYRAIDVVLTEHWDPMGVFVLGARLNEYSSYLPKIYSLAMDGDRKQIAEYLAWVANERLGLRTDPEHHLAIADMVVEAKEIAEGKQQ